METAWIKVFVLTLTQCMAPAGKIICQEETVEYQFASDEDCDRALVQMVELAARADNILIDRQKTSCQTAVRESTVFASGDEAKTALGANVVAEQTEDEAPPADKLSAAHDARLKSTKSCDDTGGVAPCRIGEIIIEPASDATSTDVWRRQQ